MKNLIHVLTILVIGLGSQLAGAVDTNFQIIVNQSNPATSIDQKFLTEIFLKKKIYWPDNQNISVVDLESTSLARREFSEKILQRSVAAVRNYWQQLLFSGRGVPPPELKTEQEVLNFVSNHTNAIGYVSSKTELRGVKAVTINK